VVLQWVAKIDHKSVTLSRKRGKHKKVIQSKFSILLFCINEAQYNT